MNRRRIGLAALVVGAGAMVRRRLRTRADPGPTPSSEPAVPALTDADTTAPALIDADTTAAVDTAAAPVLAAEPVDASDPVDAGSAPDSPVAGIVPGHGDVGIGSPAIDLPAGEQATESGHRTSGTATNSVNIADPVTSAVLGDPEIELPSSDPRPDTGPKQTAHTAQPAAVAEPDNPPRVVLPTMRPAGTKKIEEQAKPMPPTAEPPASVPTTDEPLVDSGGPTDPPPPSSAAAISFPGPTGTPVPAIPAPPPRIRSGWTFWGIAGSVLGALVIAAVIAASLVRLPYYSLKPGSVYDTIELVRAPGELVSIPTGEIGFVTVSQTANITPWQWLDAKLDGNVRLLPADEVEGDQTRDELREASIRRMQVSKDAAAVVALRKLGYDLVVTPIGIEVSQVFPCTAADGVLGTGDLIVGVDGADVRDGEQLVAALAAIGIGQDVELLVERIDPSNPTQSTHTDLVNLTLGSADAACLPDDIRADEPRAFIGIGTLTLYNEDFPIDIEILTGDVSGPSAGLAFTLAIIDVLSEGELTNGLNIVATGSIDRDGNVGPVGGIQQKTVAAERSGADVFIVPACCDNFVDRVTGEPLDLPTNYEEAVEYADDMVVIGVNTLDEALEAIGELGGDVEPFLS